MSDNSDADPLGLREFVTSTLKSILTDQEPDMLVNYVLMLISNEKTLPEIEKELEELLGTEDSSIFCLQLGAEMEKKKQEENSSSSKAAGATAGQRRILDAALSSVTTTGKRDRESGGKRSTAGASVAEVQGNTDVCNNNEDGDGASFKRTRGLPGDSGSGGGSRGPQRAPFPPRAPRTPPPPPSSANTILQQMNNMAQAAGFSSADEMMMAQQAAMQQMLMGGGGAVPFAGGRVRAGGGAEAYGGRGGRGGYNAGADAYAGGGRGRGRGWHDSHASGRGRGRAPSGGGRDPFGGRGRGKPVFEDESMTYVRVDMDGSLPSGR